MDGHANGQRSKGTASRRASRPSSTLHIALALAVGCRGDAPQPSVDQEPVGSPASALSVITEQVGPVNGSPSSVDATPTPLASNPPAVQQEAAPTKPGSWSEGIGLTVARVPSGEFTMGSPPHEAGRFYDEDQVRVRLTKDILMTTTEVTQRQYAAVIGENPSRFSKCGPDCPVERVSWLDALAFANKLSEKDGLTPVYTVTPFKVSLPVVSLDEKADGWRLPTEAEWERAARGGTSTVYSGEDAAGAVAWYDGNSGDTTHLVCNKTRNDYGLCDMSGNVMEWVWDLYRDSLSRGTDPTGPNSTGSSYRVVRGGSWRHPDAGTRVAARGSNGPEDRVDYIGIRLVRASR